MSPPSSWSSRCCWPPSAAPPAWRSAPRSPSRCPTGSSGRCSSRQWRCGVAWRRRWRWGWSPGCTRRYAPRGWHQPTRCAACDHPEPGSQPALMGEDEPARQGDRMRMRGRWGLQAKMTASYVLVTAAVVVLVEVVAAAIVLPGLISGAERATEVQLVASATANQVMQQSATLGRLPTASQLGLDQAPQGLPPSLAREPADETGGGPPDLLQRANVVLPAAAVVLLLAPDGRVVASSAPARYPVGRRLGDPAMGALPAQVTSRPPTAWGKRDRPAPTPTRNGAVLWAAAPVLDLRGLDKGTKPSPVSDLLGLVYVQVPATAKLTAEPSWWGALAPQLVVGLLVLAGAVPVGLVFGLLSTRRLVGRLR